MPHSPKAYLDPNRDTVRIRLQHIRVLLAIAENGSISAGARALGVTQPVLTRGLKLLEKQLGVALLHRTPKGAALTEYGDALVRRARLIEAEVRRAGEEIAQMRGARSGSIAIAASPVPLTLLIPKAIALFRRQFPRVHVRLTELVYPASIQAFRDGAIDFAIGPLPESGFGESLRVEPLFHVELVAAVRRGHARANARSLAELQEEEWLVAGPLHGPGEVIEQLFQGHRLRPPPSAMHCDNVPAAMEMIKHTELVAFVPRPLAALAQEAGSMQILALREKIPSVTISIYMPGQSILTPAAQVLVSALRTLAKVPTPRSRRAL